METYGNGSIIRSIYIKDENNNTLASNSEISYDINNGGIYDGTINLLSFIYKPKKKISIYLHCSIEGAYGYIDNAKSLSQISIIQLK